MDALYRATRIPATLLDLAGEVRMTSGYPALCAAYSWYDHSLNNCLLQETFRRQAGADTTADGWTEFVCAGGLVDFGTKVLANGEPVATLLVGPLLQEGPKAVAAAARAEQLGIPKKDWLQRLDQVPVVSAEALTKILQFYTDMTRVLTDASLRCQRQPEARYKPEGAAQAIPSTAFSAVPGQGREPTAGVRPEQALRESEERFRSVFVDAGIGMALTSRDDRFVQVNPEFCRFLGYSESELLKKTIDEVTHPDDRLPSKQLRRQALERQRSVINLEKRYLHRDGSVVWGRLTGVYRIGEAEKLPMSVVMVQDITAEKLAQEAVQTSEATLKSILIAVPMSVGLVKNRVFCWVNRWMVEELGYAEDELIGKSARLLYESDEEFDRVGREKYGQVRSDQMGEIQTRFRCKDGRVIDVLVRSTPIDPDNYQAGVIFTGLNISELKQTDTALRQALDEAETARQQMNGILRSVIAGLMVIDLDGRVSMVNPSVESLLERKAATMIGRPVKQVVPFPDFLDKVELALAGTEQPDPVELMLGESFFLQGKVTSVKNLQGVVRGAVAILRDISREHAINQMKDEFISAAAHELRTPMTSILGYTELMLEQLEDFELDQLRNFLQVVFERSMSLSQIISDMLDLSRVQSGRLISLEKSPGSLLELARQIVSSYRYNESGCDLAIEAEEDMPVMLFDARKMTQVFDNLLSNAVKFSPQGGRITLQLRRDPAEAVVVIRDRGIGMSPQQQERIFDKFFRADYSNTAASGLGLGMTLVKSIIEGHGGRIWVESEAGKGTSVFFTLPIVR